MRFTGSAFHAFAFVLLVQFLSVASPAAIATNDYAAVHELFAAHCIDCHAAQEPEGGLILESFESLMKGGETGPALKPRNSRSSLLMQMVEGSYKKNGKKIIMPPGKRKKLQPDEIVLLKDWIDSGALPPKQAAKSTRELVLPKIEPTAPPRRSVQALAFAAGPKLLAVARYGEVDMFSTETRAVVRTLTGHRGAVNAVAFTADGKTLVAAAGQPALFGEVRVWNVADGNLIRIVEGHADALYSVAISPDGKTMATGGYDQRIKLWELATGRELHTLAAHNGAIFDISFRPDGKILASASGDRTIKLWNVATGKRVETLSQPLKEQYSLAWSPDGRRLAAGGVDNRIRLWEVSDSAAETTNPLLLAKFAHEGAILNLAFAPDGKTLLSTSDDQTLKLWNVSDFSEKRVFEKQADVAPAIAFLSDSEKFAVGRQDGSLGYYDSAKPSALPPPAPEIKSISPRGVWHGVPTRLKLAGANFTGVTNVQFSDPRLRVMFFEVTHANEINLRLEAEINTPPGGYEVSVRGPGGESAKVKLYVDHMKQVAEAAATNITLLPVGIWGTLDTPGDRDEFTFPAAAGRTLVLELAVKHIGSKLQNGALTLLDSHGAVLGVDQGFDGGDRLVAVQVPVTGLYTVRVGDQMLVASKDHSYRLSIGELPVVTSVFPLSVRTNSETLIELAGYNLPFRITNAVRAAAAGEVDVSLAPDRYRSLKPFKLRVGDEPHGREREPNDTPADATALAARGSVNGRIDTPADVDLFRFEARAGEALVLETDAARRGSPVDTRIEVLHPDGRPVARLKMQATRNTAINFRGVDSINTGMRLDNYEEMELAEYLYMNGDVMRLFRMPQGPDSDMVMFTSAGRRRAYFDTTAVGHALDEQGFIVEPRPLDAKLPANGLPVFTLHHGNDDDGERRLGTDSKVYFTAPTNGTYLVRVTDTHGHGGPAFAYRLAVRAADPGFSVRLTGIGSAISPNSGQSFTITADRQDGFDGEIRVDLKGLPEGFTASAPLIIQAGHDEAKGTINASADARNPEGRRAMSARAEATAQIGGRTVTHEISDLGRIRLGEAPKLYVGLDPNPAKAPKEFDPALAGARPLELTIVAGETVPALLRIKRNGHEDLVTFFAENLPHGVIVADIGLNGVLIPKGESERQIFFNAAKWVPEQDRLFYMVEQQAGRQTSTPVLLKVRRDSGKSAGH